MQEFQKSEKVQQDFRKKYFSGIFNRLILDKEKYAPFLGVTSVDDVNLLTYLHFMCQDRETSVVLCHLPDVYRIVHHHVYFLNDSLSHIKNDKVLRKQLGAGSYKKLVAMSRNCINAMLKGAKELIDQNPNLVDRSAFKFLLPTSSDDDSEEIGGLIDKENTTLSNSFESSKNMTIVKVNNNSNTSDASITGDSLVERRNNRLNFANASSSHNTSSTTNTSKNTSDTAKADSTFSSTFFYLSPPGFATFKEALTKSEIWHERIYNIRERLRSTKKLLNKVKLRRVMPADHLEYSNLQNAVPKFLTELEFYAVEFAYALAQMQDEMCCFVSLQGVVMQALECLQFLSKNFFNDDYTYTYGNLYMCDFQVLHIIHMLLWQVSIVLYKSTMSSLHSAFFVEQLVNWPNVGQLFIALMNISLELNIDSCKCCGADRGNKFKSEWQLHNESILESTIKSEVLTHINSDKKPNHVVYMAASIVSNMCIIRNISPKDLDACNNFFYDFSSALGSVIVNLNKQNYLSIVTIFDAVVLCILDCHKFLEMNENLDFLAKMKRNLVMSSKGAFLRCLCQFTTWPFMWYDDMGRDKQLTTKNFLNGVEFIENSLHLLSKLKEPIMNNNEFCLPILQGAHLNERLTLLKSLLKDEIFEGYLDECMEFLKKP